VYGKLVNDLLNVDYDAISMLNVSATQELYKQMKKLQKENAACQARISDLEAKLNALIKTTAAKK
jgi:cell division protein FtsB